MELTVLHAPSQIGVYHRNLLKGLSVNVATLNILSDCRSALSPSFQTMFSSRTKHIVRKKHLLRKLVEEATIVVNVIPTRIQLNCLANKLLKPALFRPREIIQKALPKQGSQCSPCLKVSGVGVEARYSVLHRMRQKL